MAVDKIFFQSSLPRAGSTLLQNLMGQNPDFYVTPTSGLMELIYAARGNYSSSAEFKYSLEPELQKRGFAAFCNAGIHAYASAMTDKRYFLDKGRSWGFYVDWLETFMHYQPKIICMVRDLRDVFCSMEKNFRKQPDKDFGIINWQNLSGTILEKRVDMWANTPPIGIALDRLYAIIQNGNAPKILFIKYEDLCLRPETEIARIYNYLELPYFQHDFDNIPQITHEDDSGNMRLINHDIRNSLSMNQSDAKQILGDSVCDWIYNRYKWFFDYFRYNK